MSQIERLLEKLCAEQTPANFRYSELKKVMAHFGYIESNKGATSESRVKFYNPQTGATLGLRKPHPEDTLARVYIRQIVKFLKENGHL